MSRTKNTARNIASGLINKIVHIVFEFIIRSMVINVLGYEYLGLGSLFTSILQVLSLAELGFNSAVIYNMYKPVANKDKKTICALLNMYKKIYRVIGVVILSIGVLLMPFLSNFIKGDIPTDVNLYVLYVLYLFNSVSTYFLFAYKSALIIAHQRSDITTNVHTVVSIIQFTLQIALLVLFKNYYLFVIVQCCSSILNNLLIAVIAKQKYPEYFCYGDITKKQKDDIRKRVAGMMVQKLCSTTRNSLDSVFISSMLGLAAVATYSNYYTIMFSIIRFMGIITSGITASVGNSVVVETKEKNHNDMQKFNFLYMWLAGWCTICLLCLYQPAIAIWVGADHLLPLSSVILFCMYFYALMMGDIRWIYTSANGLWYENRNCTIVEAISNVVLNIILGHYFGINGIIAGTLISLFCINFIYSSRVLYKYYFTKQKISEFFRYHGIYAFTTTCIAIVTYLACSLINFGGAIELVAKGVICIILPNILYFTVYCRTDIYGDATKLIKKIIKRKL